ncbi:(StAR)-related lipid transfer [Orpheovirus IHUMI-LCC2]|uniref:(StAR)-related lipid transfer n=1 Tax=Orpheovirus IHUMI-LCC2 TaxID=2023057 RepID=A0A2I2L4L3_9VIRU|nr:(StAR)-related lipid transfer [Orpheovirus IHUMI-LCC2]SNW62492.1 (StAR)-related lipid transfer [Orpheovirus IHUMI-LCC2]
MIFKMETLHIDLGDDKYFMYDGDNFYIGSNDFELCLDSEIISYSLEDRILKFRSHKLYKNEDGIRCYPIDSLYGEMTVYASFDKLFEEFTKYMNRQIGEILQDIKYKHVISYNMIYNNCRQFLHMLKKLLKRNGYTREMVDHGCYYSKKEDGDFIPSSP